MNHPTHQETEVLVVAAMRGHTDLRGLPISDHARRVAYGAYELLGTPEAFHVGFLHDLIEDTGLTLRDMKTMGYSADIRAALRLVTHDTERHTYEQYIGSILRSGNVLALAAKLVDMRDNMLPERMDALPQQKQDFLLDRYGDTPEKLEAALEAARNPNG